MGKTSVVIVVPPLKSIVQDQIAEASLMGLTAVSLADNRLEECKISACLCVSGGGSLQVVSFVSDVNKTDRPNTTPTVLAICTFAVYFSVFQPFCCFTLVYEAHFILCYKEKTI